MESRTEQGQNMSMTFTSNINQFADAVRAYASQFGGELSVDIVNNTEYAAAVEWGWSRVIKWAELSAKQRAAIILSMKDPKRKPTGKAKVDRFAGGVRVTMPPVGMVGTSITAIEKHGQKVMNKLPKGFTNRHIKMALVDTALFGVAVISSKTPVDQGKLIGAWDIRV